MTLIVRVSLTPSPFFAMVLLPNWFTNYPGRSQMFRRHLPYMFACMFMASQTLYKNIKNMKSAPKFQGMSTF